MRGSPWMLASKLFPSLKMGRGTTEGVGPVIEGELAGSEEPVVGEGGENLKAGNEIECTWP